MLLASTFTERTGAQSYVWAMQQISAGVGMCKYAVSGVREGAASVRALSTPQHVSALRISDSGFQYSFQGSHLADSLPRPLSFSGGPV